MARKTRTAAAHHAAREAWALNLIADEAAEIAAPAPTMTINAAVAQIDAARVNGQPLTPTVAAAALAAMIEAGVVEIVAHAAIKAATDRVAADAAIAAHAARVAADSARDMTDLAAAETFAFPETPSPRRPTESEIYARWKKAHRVK